MAQRVPELVDGLLEAEDHARPRHVRGRAVKLHQPMPLGPCQREVHDVLGQREVGFGVDPQAGDVVHPGHRGRPKPLAVGDASHHPARPQGLAASAPADRRGGQPQQIQRVVRARAPRGKLRDPRRHGPGERLPLAGAQVPRDVLGGRHHHRAVGQQSRERPGHRRLPGRDGHAIPGGTVGASGRGCRGSHRAPPGWSAGPGLLPGGDVAGSHHARTGARPTTRARNGQVLA